MFDYRRSDLYVIENIQAHSLKQLHVKIYILPIVKWRVFKVPRMQRKRATLYHFTDQRSRPKHKENSLVHRKPLTFAQAPNLL